MPNQSLENRWIILLVIGVTVVSLSTAQSDKIPSALRPCKLHDANNGPCLRDLWQNILINGIKDVPGVKWTSIDPYRVKKARVSTATPAVNLNLELKKVVITGLEQSKIVNVSANNGEKFTLTMIIPKIHIKGNYVMDGRVLVLNLAGNGPFDVDLADIELGFIVKSNIVERDGDKFFNVISLKTNVKHLGNLHVKFHKLFGDNQALTDSANDVFNQNWRELTELMRPVIAESMDASLVEQAKKYLGNLPARIIFSDVS